ncbi:MAG: DnaA ATPase domain-containing protein, partial [Chlamydiales bacterium]
FVQEMLANSPSSINPIFIHGESGAGKSHLLTAIGHALKERGLRLLFVRAETFTEHVVAAIRTGAMEEFRNAYRLADVLIIDDVHVLARKWATQEELFHTFNTLHSKGKQIILSANSPPQFLEAIEPRLVSRFEWGIVLRLEKMSEHETLEWLKKRADALSLPLDAEAIDFLVHALHAHTKPLQNALHALTLRLHLQLSKTQSIDTEAVKRILSDFLIKEKQKELNPDKILRAVAAYYGIRIEDLLGKSQAKECAIPRQMAMYLIRTLLSLSYFKIGQLFSRDHSTVMSSVKLVEKKLKADSKETSAAKIELLRQLKAQE